MQHTDPFCKYISKRLLNGRAPHHESDTFTHFKGLLYKHLSDAGKQFLTLVIPKSWKFMVLVEAHDKLGHQGNNGMYNKTTILLEGYEYFIDHITQSLVDICVTETFLTEQNTVTCAALHLPGFAFQDQPRSNAARGGIGIFYCDSFQLSKLSHTERRSFELSEWHVSWHNYCLCNHQPYSTSHPITNATFMHEFESYLDETVLVRKCYASLGISTYMPDDTYGCQFNDLHQATVY